MQVIVKLMWWILVGIGAIGFLYSTYFGSSLSEAIQKRDVDRVKFLLTFNSIDPNTRTSEGWTALMLAADMGDVDLCKLLLVRNDVRVDMRDEYGDTALAIAISMKHFKVAKLLLAEGVCQNLNFI